jgi:hypothetical protein
VTALIACAVCFGASDAPMAVATNIGIFLMLGVVVVMLAGFAGFFVYLNRRAKALAGRAPSKPAAAYAEGSGEPRRSSLENERERRREAGSRPAERDVRFGTNPQEGTA